MDFASVLAALITAMQLFSSIGLNLTANEKKLEATIWELIGVKKVDEVYRGLGIIHIDLRLYQTSVNQLQLCEVWVWARLF
jgi:hypothetical protein